MVRGGMVRGGMVRGGMVRGGMVRGGHGAGRTVVAEHTRMQRAARHRTQPPAPRRPEGHVVWEREGPVRLPPRPHISGAQLRKLRVTKPVQERGALAAAPAPAPAPPGCR